MANGSALLLIRIAPDIDISHVVKLAVPMSLTSYTFRYRPRASRSGNSLSCGPSLSVTATITADLTRRSGHLDYATGDLRILGRSGEINAPDARARA